MAKLRTIVVPGLLAVVLLIAVALPTFIQARDKSQLNACINNLRMLSEPMTCCVPMSKRLTTGDTLNPKDVFEFVRGNAMPICPGGGAYEVSWIVGGSTPTCSVHGDVFRDLYQVTNMLDLDKRLHQEQAKAMRENKPAPERRDDVKPVEFTVPIPDT